MALSHFTVELDPPNAPVVKIDALTLPAGAVQGVQIEQATPSDLPQLVLYMSTGPLTVNGEAIVSTEPTDAPDLLRAFLAQVDPQALSEAAAALAGRPDPRNPTRYMDNPTEALLVALSMMVDEA